jgi:hypothetical protein
MIDLCSHATRQEKLPLNIIFPFSTMQAYSTNIYITSIKQTMQNYNSKTSKMNYTCPRLIINAVYNAQDNHKSCIIRLGQGIILRATFLLNSVWRLELGMKIEDSRSSEHWQELSSRTNNALRLCVESCRFFWRKLVTLPFCHGQGKSRVLSDVGIVLATTKRQEPENIILLSTNIQLQLWK